MTFLPKRPRCRTILVHEHITGGGLAGRDLPTSWAAEGGAMRRALVADFASVADVHVRFTLDARFPDEPGSIPVVREAIQTVGRLSAEADYTVLIAPETGGLLHDLSRAVERAGGRSLGSTPAAIELTADKLRLEGHLRSRRLPTPVSRSVRPRLGLPRDAGYPAVLKPIDGAGSVDTLFVESAEDPIASTFAADVGLLQPFVRGEPRSATFLVSPRGDAVLLGLGYQHIERTSGRFSYIGGTIVDETMPDRHETRRAIASVEGLAGLVGVDYIQHEPAGPALILDINPRPTTSCVGLIVALGPGCLAAAWLSMVEDAILLKGLEPLARPYPPLRFNADGTFPR